MFHQTNVLLDESVLDVSVVSHLKIYGHEFHACTDLEYHVCTVYRHIEYYSRSDSPNFIKSRFNSVSTKIQILNLENILTMVARNFYQNSHAKVPIFVKMVMQRFQFATV